MKRKALSLLLALCMIMTLTPVTALADGDDGDNGTPDDSKTPVAQIGETTYTSLDGDEGAIAKVESGETIQLLADVILADNTPLKIVDKGSADSPIILDLNGRTISGSNKQTGATATASAPGGILHVNNSYVTLTDNSTGTKGSIVNTYSTASAMSIAVVANGSSQLEIDGGITIKNENSNTSSKALYIYGASAAINNAVVISGGYTVAVSGTRSSVTIDGGEYTSNEKGNTTTAFSVSIGSITVNGGTFHNWALGDSKYLSDSSYFCVAEENGVRTVTIQKAAPTDYIAVITGTRYYQTSGDLYQIYYLSGITSSGGEIVVKKSTSLTSTASASAFGNIYATPKSLTLNLDAGVTLSGTMLLKLADVTVTGDGTLADNFFSNYTGYEMTVNGENGLYSSRLAEDSIAAVVIQDDGSEQPYDTLPNAVSNADGKTIKLMKNIENVIKIGLSGGQVANIDLNGYNIGFGANYFFNVAGGTLNLTGSGKVYEQSPNYGSIVVKGATSDKADYSVVTVGENVTLEGWAGVFIDSYSTTYPHAYGVKVTVDGTLNSVRDTSGSIGSGVYINGTIKDTTGNVPQITLSETSKITSLGNGIYAAGYAIWNLAGDMTGENAEALSIKSGTFNITGGTYIAKGAFADPAAANGNGSEATGAALSITSNDGYAKKVDVTVTGGTFISENGYAVYEGIAKKGDGTDAASASYATLTISGGQFQGSSEKGSVSITTATNKNVISGGYYTSDPSEYVAESYAAVPSDKAGYAFMIGVAEETDVLPATGDNAVDVSNIDSTVQDTVKTIAEGITIQDGVLAAAANAVLNKVSSDEQSAAVEQLKKENSIGSEDSIYIYAQTYLDIRPTEYDSTNSQLTVDIEPKYRVVASTAENAENIQLDGGGKNAIVLEDSEQSLPDDIFTTIDITVPLPSGFTANEGTTYYVRHQKGGESGNVYYYPLTIRESNATFTNPNGFSTFTLPLALDSVSYTRVGPNSTATPDDEGMAALTTLTASMIGQDTGSSDIKWTPSENDNIPDGYSWKYQGVNVYATKEGTKEYIAENLYQWTEEVFQEMLQYQKDGWTLYADIAEAGAYLPTTTGSNSSGSSSVTTYPVSVDTAKNGTVSVSPKNASKGTTVTITAKPADGYEVDEVIVTDKNGDTVKVTAKGNDKYTFVMPAGKVDVEVTFVKETVTPSVSFTDVKSGAWYYGAAIYAAENGLMSGTGNGAFSPDLTTSRAMIWTILARVDGQNVSVTYGNWYDKARAWAMAAGVSDGTNPDNPITREQLAVMLYGFAKDQGYTTTGGVSLSRYVDASDVSSWAVEALEWAVGNGLISSMGNNILAPTGTATRAQVAVILMNFCENIVK